LHPKTEYPKNAHNYGQIAVVLCVGKSLKKTW